MPFVGNIIPDGDAGNMTLDQLSSPGFGSGMKVALDSNINTLLADNGIQVMPTNTNMGFARISIESNPII